MGLTEGISSEHLSAIGRIAVEFGELEFLVNQLIVWEIHDVEKIAKILDKEGSLKRRVDYLKKRFDGKYPKCSWKPKFDSLVASILRLKDARNDVLHAVWLAK